MASAPSTSKAGWVTKDFPDVVFIQEGPGIRKYEYEEGGYPMINVRCVKDGYIDMGASKSANNELATGKWKHFQIEAGDILFTISGTIGRSAIVQEDDLPLLMNTSVVRFRPTTADLSTRFLYYSVRIPSFINELNDRSTGTAIKNVGPTHIKKLQISYPPLAEQERIVGILDEAFEGIAAATAQAEKNLHKARELFQSVLQSTFSQKGEDWVERQLSEISEKITDGTHQTPRYFENGYMFLSSKNVKDGVIDWDDIKFIDKEQHIKMQQRLAPRLNDILLRKNGAGFGKAALVNRDVIFDVYVSLAVIRPLDSINPAYLLHFINSPSTMQQFNKRVKGAGVPNLHLKEIREVVISFPISLPTQQAIVEKLDALSEETKRLEAIYERKKAALTELKQSLLQKAFAGEL